MAAQVGVHAVTVSKWRHRFATDRLEGLVDAPRPGAKRRIGDDVIEAVVVDTLETAPEDATHWSTRDLAIHENLDVFNDLSRLQLSGSVAGGFQVSTREPVDSDDPIAQQFSDFNAAQAARRRPRHYNPARGILEASIGPRHDKPRTFTMTNRPDRPR